jgi:prevent-host-death family protein
VSWQLQEAKQHFSELVRRALDEGPQVVTRRGEEAVVVVSVREFRRLAGAVPDFKAFLLAAPDLEALDVRRGSDRVRAIWLPPQPRPWHGTASAASWEARRRSAGPAPRRPGCWPR